MLPFMYVRYKDNLLKKIDKYIVVISECFDYTHAETAWMDDAELPNGRVLEPSIDLVAGPESYHYFDSEKEMIAFVANWYKENIK